MLRKMELLLDELDYDAIQREITTRQTRPRRDGKTALPDTDSNLAGAILAECCRDLIEYRELFDETHQP